MKFLVSKNLDYLNGHLRYGHKEATVECESKEELMKILADKDFIYDMDTVVDDYEIDDYEVSDEDYEIEEVE